METITFYSYKGGVGRTLALANVAVYLSRFRQKVCILDFDLEAPGMNYKFHEYTDSKIKKGLVDYISDITNNQEIPETLDDYSIEIISQSNSQGGITLIPAGNVLSPSYWEKLASINWHKLFFEGDSYGVPLFLELKERIKNEFNPDFILIDSRTGITEMSGLCTTVLPDSVVFLIVNNAENIEGARQILQGIQKHIPINDKQKITTKFVLTRIPTMDDEEIEKEIVNNIKNQLNVDAKLLENTLDIDDIIVIHSDRDLELKESLRMSSNEITQNYPLVRDYLKLISNIIPDEIILPKLDDILDEITFSVRMFKDPDETQKELESIALSYPHPQSLERLINFYFLRNEDRAKILETYDRLWNTFGISKEDTLEKYIGLFMNQEELRTSNDPYSYNLRIVEKYLDINPNELPVKHQLAKGYRTIDATQKSMSIYSNLLKENYEKHTILSEMLTMALREKRMIDIDFIFDDYNDVIESDRNLKLLKVRILYKHKKLDDIEYMLNDGVTSKQILEGNISLYYNIMTTLNRTEFLDDLIEEELESSIINENQQRIRSIGTIYYSNGRSEEFDFKIQSIRNSDRIMRDLQRRYGPRNR